MANKEKSFLSMGFDELENDLVQTQQVIVKPKMPRVITQPQPQLVQQQMSPQPVVSSKPVYTNTPKVMSHTQMIRDSIDVPLMAEFASKAKKGKRQSLQLYVYPDVKREVAKIMNKYNLSENAVGNILLRRALGLDSE